MSALVTREPSVAKRVLVVDDDASFLNEARALLQEGGFEVRTCEDPLQAVDVLEKETFACVLLDYRMPKLDGEDVLQLIRSKRPEVPVVMCSGYLAPDETRFIREGAYEILHKPFDHHRLFDVLGRAMASEEDVTSILIHGYDLRAARETLVCKLIIKTLSRSDWNVTHAAKLLGVSRQCLLSYLKRYHIAH